MNRPRKIVGLLAGVLFFLPAALAATPSVEPFDHAHRQWDTVLKEYTHSKEGSTWVDYRSLSKSPSRLEGYLQELGSVPRPIYESWHRSQQLAFLINAYNAWTVQLILSHYPIESILEIEEPWKQPVVRLWGEAISLDRLEHGLIRPDFDEPRIHFAVNCAARSCPQLRREAFVASRLEEQLEESAQQFLDDDRNNRLEQDSGKVRLNLSKIFEWYGNDFQSRYGGVLPFVAPRISGDAKIKSRIREGKAEVHYLEYDWGLNGH
ncbi:MAG: DUF547 domain-containing protein [Acidobacteriota bacterium]